MRKEGRDDIQAILHHSGMFSRRLQRMEQVSTEMQELEWKMMKSAAALANKSSKLLPSGE